MKVSIITVVFNNLLYIKECIESVLSQTYPDIEYIVIDNRSDDGTENIIQEYRDEIDVIISEKDNGYIDAMNKGIKMAQGDVIGFLHSDDFYADQNVIKDVVRVFQQNKTDSVYGDLIYIKKGKKKVFRYWKSGDYNLNKMGLGWMPPHPTFFVRRKVYEKYGLLDNKNFQIAMDYEFILRLFYKHKITTKYMPKVLVKMRTGGLSNKGIKNIIIKTREDYKTLKQHGLGLKTLLMKNLRKVPQFFKKG